MSKWMEQALHLAREAAAQGEIPVGAVIVRGDELIAACHNQREALHDPTAHAEILCMRKAAEILGDWRLRDCTLYVTLEPCPMCAGAMVMAQLGKCVYGAADPRQGCCGSVYDLPADPHLHGTTVWQGGVMAGECLSLMQSFFQDKR